MPYKDPEKQRLYLEEYSRDYHQKRYDKRKAEMLAYLGDQCKNCKSIDNLEFDHISRKDKKFAITKMWNRKWEIIEEELKKCQLLCNACHLEKTRRERKGD